MTTDNSNNMAVSVAAVTNGSCGGIAAPHCDVHSLAPVGATAFNYSMSTVDNNKMKVLVAAAANGFRGGVAVPQFETNPLDLCMHSMAQDEQCGYVYNYFCIPCPDGALHVSSQTKTQWFR